MFLFAAILVHESVNGESILLVMPVNRKYEKRCQSAFRHVTPIVFDMIALFSVFVAKTHTNTWFLSKGYLLIMRLYFRQLRLNGGLE